MWRDRKESGLFFLDLGNELRDAGFPAVGASAGDNALSDGPIVASHEFPRESCGLFGVRSELGELFGKRPELGKNGLVFGAFARVTPYPFCS